MAHDKVTTSDDPYREVELILVVDGKELPLNEFSRTAIARAVSAIVSSYRGAEKYREHTPRRLEVRLS